MSAWRFLFAIRPSLLRIDRRRDPADRRAADQLADLVGGSYQLHQIDTGRDAHTLEHVSDIFRRNIACGARRVGAAAKTAGGGIDHARPLLHSGIEIGERLGSEEHTSE